MPRSTDWVGTDLELLDFLTAINRHCTCPDLIGGTCSAHQLIRADQATINRLVFARRIADRLVGEEFRFSSRVSAPADPHLDPGIRRLGTAAAGPAQAGH
jgi:hypothetical protein